MNEASIVQPASATPAATPVTAPPPQRRKRLRVPLQAAAAIGVILLLAVVAGVLSWQAYNSSRQALLSASDETLGYVRDALAEKTRRILEPASAQLGILTRSPLSEANTLPDRLRQVPLMLDALRHNALLDAIYIGYPDGEFVLFRSLRDQKLRDKLVAPEQAVMVVQTITLQENGTMLGEYRFYDIGSNLLSAYVDPNYKFDPRNRGWYQATINQSDAVLTDPYVFFTTNTVGITLAQRTVDGGGVVGLDLEITSIADQVKALKITPSAEVALINRKQLVIGYRDASRMIIRDQDGGMHLATVDELGSAPLQSAWRLSSSGQDTSRSTATIGGETWQLMLATINVTDTRKVRLLIAIPNSEFFATAQSLVVRQLQVAGLIMLVAILAAWFLTKLLVNPLRRIAGETGRIERFDFTSDARIASSIGEIDDLGRALHGMKRTIRNFLKIGRALAAERDFKPLLNRVLQETINVTRVDGGAIYMLDDAQEALVPESVHWMRPRPDLEGTERPKLMLGGAGVLQTVAEALESQDLMVAERTLDAKEMAALGLEELVDARQAESMAFVIVPLLDRNQATFGVLLLVKAVGATTGSWRIDERLLSLVHAVSGNASVAIQNKLLLDAQRALIDALIKLVAGAIDAKSAYTGGHCQRVPVLTRLLADAAVRQESGPFQSFGLNDEEWDALNIAAWLHDCGKVTTPEYVVDKATKLETIYDRIHEIRMRFEVLKRQAEIDYWRGRVEGGDEAALRQKMEEQKRLLDDDFAFIAKANEGGEFMEPAKLERIKQIAGRRWTRTISNRLGVSYEERRRFDRTPEPALPVEEPLLADRDDHIVPLEERDVIASNNPWGFALTPPKVKYNRGEVYNLSVARGTLTEEERYRINDHIMQTIIMLQSLPFPKHLRNVPELAGGHHEKMDGTGYPKRLMRGDMSIVARIMAIADVFEALTAADRPYKKAKKISEAVKIMGFMKKDNHLDPDLLDLFLTSGVWQEYADLFLDPEQIDKPDIAAVLATKPQPIQARN